MQRSRGVADGMSKGINFLFKKNKIETVSGTGKVLAPGKVEVTKADGSKETVEAKHIILATGARSRELPNLPIDNKKIIGYRKAMVLEQMPKRLVVVGSGAIGVEFAYFYRTMGSEVTIVEFMPRIVPVEDEESVAADGEVLQKDRHEYPHQRRSNQRGHQRAKAAK